MKYLIIHIPDFSVELDIIPDVIHDIVHDTDVFTVEAINKATIKYGIVDDEQDYENVITSAKKIKAVYGAYENYVNVLRGFLTERIPIVVFETIEEENYHITKAEHLGAYDVLLTME